MRRVVSYEGAHGVPASQRLKHKLSLAPGLHLFSGNLIEEDEGIFATVGKTRGERIIHKTSWATRNFVASASTLGKVAKREPWVVRSDTFRHVVAERSVFDVSAETDKHDHGCSSLKIYDLDGSPTYGAGNNDVGTSQGSEEVTRSSTASLEWSGPSSKSTASIRFDTRHDRSQDTTVLESGNWLDRPKIQHPKVSGSGGSDSLESVLAEHLVNVAVPCNRQLERESAESDPLSIGHAESSGTSLAPSPSRARHTETPQLVSHEADTLMDTGSVECKDAAASTIEKHWRGWVQRKHYRASVRRVVKLQSLVRMNLAVRQYHRFLKAAIMLQRNWRVFQSTRSVNRVRVDQDAWEQQRISNAATVLQKHWLGFRSRHSVKFLKMERDISARLRMLAAAITLQKHWRALQSRRLAYDLKKERVEREQERVDDAVIILQKHWRSFQGRRLFKHLKMDQIVSEQQRLHNAATVVQKCWQVRALSKRLKRELVVFERQRDSNAAVIVQMHWRAFLTRQLVKHLKMEQVVREQQKVDNAAMVVQKHWRAFQSKRLEKNLKMKQVVREQQRVRNATILLQRRWRTLRSRQLSEKIKLELAHREQAAVLIQTHVKGNAVRKKLKTWHSAARSIQKVWNKYCQSRVRPQAFNYSIQVQQGLDQEPNLAHLSQAPEHSYNGLLVGATRNAGMIPFSELNFEASDTSKYLSERQRVLEFCPSDFLVQHDVYIQSGVQIRNSIDCTGKLDHGFISSLPKGDSSLNEGLSCELSASTVEVLQELKDRECKECNCGAVDRIDGCVEVISPLPRTHGASLVCQKCVHRLGIPVAAEQLSYVDQGMGSEYAENLINVGRKSVLPGPLSIAVFNEILENDTGWNGSDTSCAEVYQTTTLAQSNPEGFQSSPTVAVRAYSGPQKLVEPNKIFKPSKSHQSCTLEHNEKKLQQFAQVFLLQRHIALQQQRAQAAPPFPPVTTLGCMFPSHISTQVEPRDFYYNDDGQKVVRSISSPTEVTGVRSVECELVCKEVNAGDHSSLRKHPERCWNEQLRETPGTDVVLDMVLLLRQMQEYGTSKVEFEGESSTCFPSGYGDIEEDDRNLGLVRKQSSAAVKFAEAVGMNRLSIPDVNAVLLILIAMVVYTRTICQGVFFGTRQPYRRI